MKGDNKKQVKILPDQELEYAFAIDFIHYPGQYTTAFCRLSYNRIFFITDGSGILLIDDKSFKVEGRELFLLGKGQVFSFIAVENLKGYEIRFGDFFWEKSPASAHNCKSILFNNTASNQHIPLSETEEAKLIPLFSSLHAEYLGESYLNKLDALAAYLKIIMIKIANINALLIRGFDSYENQLYRKFLDMLSKQYSDRHDVSAYALQLGLTTRKLTELCKNISGKGAKEIIDEQIISEAKRALQFSSKPIKEIAYQLNFSSPERFSHFFKRITRLSPDHYRSQFV
jgi:AraC family transcriptional activator of pobA